MISTLKEVREALHNTLYAKCDGMDVTPLERAHIAGETALTKLDALIAQEKAEPVGEWKLVPIELTDEMIDAAWDSDGVDYVGEYKRINHIDLAYKAMLAVAPKAPQPAPSTSPVQHVPETNFWNIKPLTDEQIYDLSVAFRGGADWSEEDFDTAKLFARAIEAKIGAKP